MAGALDKKMTNLAKKLLQKFGKNATYTKVTTGVYDPTTSTVTNTTLEYPITIYIDKVTNGDITSGIADATDVKILVSSLELGVDVVNGDKIVDDKTYEVKKVLPTYSGAEIALYEVIGVVR